MRHQKLFAVGAAMLAPALFLTVLSGANSPVADAAMRGDAAAIRTLLTQKADVNLAQADGATAIQWAAYRDDATLADLLIAAKADVKLPNREGVTPLRLAATNGSAAMIDRLIKAGANPNETGPNGETPLMYASRNGNPAAVKALIAAKADFVYAGYPDGFATAIHSRDQLRDLGMKTRLNTEGCNLGPVT